MSFPVFLTGDFPPRATPQLRHRKMNHKDLCPAVPRHGQPAHDRIFDGLAMCPPTSWVLNTGSIEKTDGYHRGSANAFSSWRAQGGLRAVQTQPNCDEHIQIPEYGNHHSERTECPPLRLAGSADKGPDLAECSGISGWVCNQKMVQPGHKLASGKHPPKSSGRSGLKPCGVHMRTEGNRVLQNSR